MKNLFCFMFLSFSVLALNTSAQADTNFGSVGTQQTDARPVIPFTFSESECDEILAILYHIQFAIIYFKAVDTAAGIGVPDNKIAMSDLNAFLDPRFASTQPIEAVRAFEFLRKNYDVFCQYGSDPGLITVEGLWKAHKHYSNLLNLCRKIYYPQYEPEGGQGVIPRPGLVSDTIQP